MLVELNEANHHTSTDQSFQFKRLQNTWISLWLVYSWVYFCIHLRRGWSIPFRTQVTHTHHAQVNHERLILSNCFLLWREHSNKVSLNLSLTGLSQLLHDIFEYQGKILMSGFCCCFFFICFDFLSPRKLLLQKLEPYFLLKFNLNHYLNVKDRNAQYCQLTRSFAFWREITLFILVTRR